MRTVTALIIVVALSACTAENLGEAPESTSLATAQQPIIGGEKESGWKGVGAVTSTYPGYGYMGSHCSGTLIAPQWVLTAAHCVMSDDMPVEPELTRFFIGPNANDPYDGTLHWADSFYPHPKYNPNKIKNDIALIHLAQPVEGVKTYDWYSGSITQDMFGLEAFYVGYGVTNGKTNSGGGVKRSAYVAISGAQGNLYYSEFVDAGVCFGDSGGPGLLQYEDEELNSWYVIGVNSFVGGMGGTQDPCKDTLYHTSVGEYSDWIDSHVLGEQPVCTDDLSLCWCDEACSEDGVCDNEVCKTTNCKEYYYCLVDCHYDSSCTKECYITATDEAKKELAQVLYCYYQFCGWFEGEDWDKCVELSCQDPIAACIPPVFGEGTCIDIYTCTQECEDDSYSCQMGCMEEGTEGAQAEMEEMRECMEAQCDNVDSADYYSCLLEQCGEEMYKCVPSSGCSMTGGGCLFGDACYPILDNINDCFPSEDFELDALCDPNVFLPVHCADGMVCAPMDDGFAHCMPGCNGDHDCAPEDFCDFSAFQDSDKVGACLCRDEDGDGWCMADECDDSSILVNPSLGELCFDGIDNDCDGEIDENCGPDEPEVQDVLSQDATPDNHSVVGNIPNEDDGDGCSAAPNNGPAAPLPLLVTLLALLALASLGRNRRRT